MSKETSSTAYDVIIAGAGAAGLTLAYSMCLSPTLRDKKVLMLDKDAKTTNDRTWCFWEAGQGLFDDILHRSWDQAQFHGTDFGKRIRFAPYQYKMIRGLDFYQSVLEAVSKNKNFEFKQESIESISETEEMGAVTTSKATYSAPWVFNSTPWGMPESQKQKYNYLLQHFKGYEITTRRPVFDPECPMFMDFRVEQGQQNDARFGYILPENAHEALVEYTVFSPELWEEEAYTEALHEYLQTYLNLTEDDYEVRRIEAGVIPMTDQYFPPKQGERIISLGTTGGQTRASTGYTFQRIQKHTRQIIQNWETKGSPVVEPSRWDRRFTFYDAVLLEVMEKQWVKSRDIFTRIFQRNPESRVFRFLDESTKFKEEIAIMNSMPYMPFLRAVGNKIFKYAFR